jgi:hypothetical protein
MPGIRAKPVSQNLCVLVIDVETLRPVFQRHQRRCRQHAGLAHAAAEHLANHAAALDQILRADDHRAHGRAEPLAEAKLYGVEFFRHLGDVLVEINRRVKNARAVEVNSQTGRMRLIADSMRQRLVG